jgi:predicted nucleic acid-binding protein
MLLDTSGLLCYFDRSDVRHQDSRIYFNAAPRKVTHTYVLAEFVALAQVRGMPRQESLTFVLDILQGPEVETVWVSQELYWNAIALLQVREEAVSPGRRGRRRFR